MSPWLYVVREILAFTTEAYRNYPPPPRGGGGVVTPRFGTNCETDSESIDGDKQR